MLDHPHDRLVDVRAKNPLTHVGEWFILLITKRTQRDQLMYARITITDEITGEYICTAKVGLTEDWGHLFFDIDTQAALDAACLEAGTNSG